MAAHGVGLLPKLALDDRFPRSLKAITVREDAQRRFGLDDADDRAGRPVLPTVGSRDALATQVVGDLAPANSGRALFEDPLHDLGGVVVNDRLAVLTAIAEGRPLWIATRLDRPRHPGRGVLLGLVAYRLRHDQDDPEHR